MQVVYSLIAFWYASTSFFPASISSSVALAPSGSFAGAAG